MPDLSYWSRPRPYRSSRRALIRTGSLTGAGLALAACGGSGSKSSTGAGSSAGGTFS